MSIKEENKFDWFMKQEKQSMEDYNGRQFLKERIEPTYQEIKNSLKQLELFDDDFNECDSGYCGV